MRIRLPAGLACVMAAVLVLLLPQRSRAQDYSGVYAAAEVGVGIIESAGSTIVGPVEDSESSGLIGGALGFHSPLGESGRVLLGLEGSVGLYLKETHGRIGAYGIGGVRIGATGLAYLRLGYVALHGVETGVGEGVDGPAFGGGFTFGLREKLGLRIDYRYIDYGGVDVPDNTMDFDGHEVTAAVVFDF